MSQSFLLQDPSGTHSLTITEAGDMLLNDDNIKDLISNLRALGILSVSGNVTVTHTAPPTTVVVTA